MADDDDSRTYEATSHRRDEFRKQGRYARARDVGALAAMAAVTGTLLGMRPVIDASLRTLFARTHGDLTALARHDLSGTMQAVSGAMTAMALPGMIAAFVGAAVVGAAQSGARLHWELAAPRMDRLDPAGRLMQLFSPRQAFVETTLAMLRVLVVAAVVQRVAKGELPDLMLLSRAPLEAAPPRVLAAAARVVFSALGALGLIAAADYGQSWFQLEQQLKMTRRELEEETRQQDGDPKAKGRMRAKARAQARQRSLQAVRQADVVVTNPTHVAVALRYGMKDPAPVVVAKGHDALALQIRAEARKHGVPILEHRALARALDAEVKVGRTIPAKHFMTVAKVLAFVYRLRPRGSARR